MYLCRDCSWRILACVNHTTLAAAHFVARGKLQRFLLLEGGWTTFSEADSSLSTHLFQLPSLPVRPVTFMMLLRNDSHKFSNLKENLNFLVIINILKFKKWNRTEMKHHFGPYNSE